MAQRVGFDVFTDAGIPRMLFYQTPNPVSGEGLAAPVYKEAAFRSGRIQGRAGGVYVVLQCLAGRFAEGNDPFFGALAKAAKQSRVEADIFDRQRSQFADAQSAGVEEFEQGAVANPERVMGVGRGE